MLVLSMSGGSLEFSILASGSVMNDCESKASVAARASHVDFRAVIAYRM
jgi:hypothetical protein